MNFQVVPSPLLSDYYSAIANFILYLIQSVLVTITVNSDADKTVIDKIPSLYMKYIPTNIVFH